MGSLVFNVRDYGARGDGIAYDRPAIHKAVAAASAAGGGIVYLPPGTYNLNLLNPIEVPDEVTLRGYGTRFLG